MSKKKYDVAILGVWYGLNYGSLLTYYALRKKIQEAGKSVVMVKYLPENKPASVVDEEVEDAHNNLFIARQGYETYTVNHANSRTVNELAETFVIGSDQVWNYPIAKLHDGFFYMSEIDADKRKIANAVSFGHAIDFAPEQERSSIANLMKRFNAISVREDSGVELIREKYGVPAEWQADPLLTIDAEDICTLAINSKIDFSAAKPYLLAYILDPYVEKIEGIRKLAEKLRLDIRIIVDGFKHNRDQNIQKLEELADKVQAHVGVEEFVSLFKNSTYVVTDSFHGAVMSLKMEKEFCVTTASNMHRGMARLESLFKITGLAGRHTFDPKVIALKNRFVAPIDYKKIRKIISRVSKISNVWLTTALEMPVDMKIGISPIGLENLELTEILLKKKTWNLRLKDKPPYTSALTFLANGTIKGVQSDNESYWEVQNSRLLVKNKKNELTHIFSLKSIDFGQPVFYGDTVFDHSLIHILD